MMASPNLRRFTHSKSNDVQDLVHHTLGFIPVAYKHKGGNADAVKQAMRSNDRLDHVIINK